LNDIVQLLIYKYLMENPEDKLIILLFNNTFFFRKNISCFWIH